MYKKIFKCKYCGEVGVFLSELTTHAICSKCDNEMTYCETQMRIEGTNRYKVIDKNEEYNTENTRLNITYDHKPKCPTCQSTHIQKINTIRRAVSFGIKGFASSSVGKQFECLDCSYKW